jgi:hypothetical protein
MAKVSRNIIMNSQRATRKFIEIFPAALLSQRGAWEKAAHLLPPNTCLLVTDTKTQKQVEVMRMVARSFRNAGWQVLIWSRPSLRPEN